MEDRRFALLASVMANLWRGKGQKEFSVSDFMPKDRAEERRLALAREARSKTPQGVQLMIAEIKRIFKFAEKRGITKKRVKVEEESDDG